MNGLKWFHLEYIKEDEICAAAAKNAYWSLSDGWGGGGNWWFPSFVAADLNHI